MAVGDLLMHQDVKAAAEEAEGGFPSLWSGLEPLFRRADLVVGNLETPIAPQTGLPGRPFVFNAPGGLAPALRSSGFQVLSTANNHAFDQGSLGVIETLLHLEAADLHPLGSGRSQEAAEEPLRLERRGIRFALLGRTDLFNHDLNRPGKGPWVAPLDLDRTCEVVRAVRPQVDVVVLSVHWGTEYQVTPTKRQLEASQALVEAGVDLIVGHHPHVLQPLAWVVGGARRGAVAYSLGNFISNQDRTYRPGLDPAEAGDNRDGGALVATFRKEAGRPAVLASVHLQPLWTENNWGSRATGQARAREIRVIPTGTDAVGAIRRERVGQVLRGTWELRQP